MPEFEKLKKIQLNAIKTSGGLDYMQATMGEAFQVQQDESLTYDESFINKEVDSQQTFYEEYKKNHGEVYSGQKISPPAFADKKELEIQDQNLSYFQRKDRKKKAKEQSADWIKRLNRLNTHKDPKSKSKYQPAFGLCLTKNYGTYAVDIMNSTVRYVAMENKKDAIIADALKNAPKEKKELFLKYKEQIKALGPSLECQPTEEVKDQIIANTTSINNYTDYIKRAIEDPVSVIKEAVNDAVLSYGQISEKMLSKHAIPQKFDVLKQIRDRYKVVHELFTSVNKSDEAVASLSDLKKDLNLRDNILFASEVYMRLDVDLAYSLKHYGIRYDRPGFLDDDMYSMQAYRQTGEETLNAFKQIKNRKRNDKDTMVDNYWKAKISKEVSLVTKEKAPEIKEEENKEELNNEEVKKEKKEEKKEEKKDNFTDKFDVVKTVNVITKDVKFADEHKQELFEKVSTQAKKLGKAVENIDIELEAARKVVADSKAMRTLSVGARNRIKWYINVRQQEQLDLMDRISAYMNALRYLTGKNVLRANGSKVLQEYNYIEKASDFKQDNDVVVIEDKSFVTNEGSGKNLISISNEPMTFQTMAEKLTIKFLNHENTFKLDIILETEAAYINYYLLQLQNVNVMEMSFDEVCLALGKEVNKDEAAIKLANAIKDYNTEIDNVYERMQKMRMFVLPINELEQLVDRACLLRQKNLAIKKLKNSVMTEQDNKDVTYLEYLKKIDDKSMAINPKVELLSQMKYKLIFDELEQYKCTQAMEHLANDTAVNVMFTDWEQDKLAALKKKYTGAELLRQQRFFFEQRKEMFSILAGQHRKELIEYLEKEKDLMKADYAKKSDIRKNIKEENKKYDEQKKEKDEKKIKEREERKKKEEEVKAEKERQKKEKERLEKELKEQKEKEQKEKERIEQEKNKEKDKKDEVFVAANKLKTKYTTSAPEKKIPYTRTHENEPTTDTWAHAFASIINYQAGKDVVEGKDLLNSKEKDRPEIFGENRFRDGDPFAFADLAFKYIPNTAMCKTSFEGLEGKSKTEFLSFIKQTIDKNKAPIVLKRKMGYLTIYGISANNQLVCRRSTSDFVNDTYEEDPDFIFNDQEKNGEVALYWFEKLSEKKEQIEKNYGVSVKENKVTTEAIDGSLNQTDDEFQNQELGIRRDKKVNEQVVKQYIPKQLLDKKTADEQIKKLKKKNLLMEPPILEYQKTISVEEPEVHPQYEFQGNTEYCWACALSGLINYKAGKKISSMSEIRNYKTEIPGFKSTAIKGQANYDDAVATINGMKAGTKVGNPMIFGDYLFKKMPDTAIRTAHIGKYAGKDELCKRRFKEILSKNLENGPVALLRKKHFVLIYKLDGNKIYVKNSGRTDADTVKEDYYNVDSLFDEMTLVENVELVYLQDLKGKEKQIADEFDAFTYDDKKKQFERKDKDANPINSADSLLHKDGIETAKVDPEDVVVQSIYVPKQLSKAANK